MKQINIFKQVFLIILFFSLVSITNIVNGQTKTIFCFGNSLTAGYGMAQEESWPMLIQDRLDELGYDYDVIASGLSGETSAGGVSRIKWVLKNRDIDIFILELGPNDGLRGLPPEKTKENLQRIIDYVLSLNKDAKIIIAGMKVPPNMGPEYSEKFEDIFPSLSKDNNATLIPFFLDGVAGDRSLNLSDGIHPNKEGQKVVANTVWKYLKPLL